MPISTKRKSSAKMFGTGTAYNFVDKDPIIDRLRTACAPFRLSDVAKKSGVAYGTLWSMFNGATVSPKYSTVARIVRSLHLIIPIGWSPKQKGSRR